MQLHYFLAIPLPDLLKKQVMSSVQSEVLSFKRWVHWADLHLTLVFLGACTEEQLDFLQHNCKNLLSNWNRFTLELSSLGTFGKEREPRIFWVGVKEQALLHSLRKDVYNLCLEAGFSLEKRPFSPHITVARKWIGDHAYHSKIVDETLIGEKWQVDKVILYKSVLTEEPKYKEVNVFPMSGDEK
ncbi:RNA 2',3'-cyclic phosphodiesterase [Halalkalibacter krulwichiae]|uniref:RNA 2',3'-cyclic phosphodiesterase n=1 Tax=Halalkalibacter krulwichiae TaxID=199441 RepID=A0A1X9MHV9_9BACI|nr:RNA 2',3'-cyclic phosphodiesterase [Halalkalibacter krulwichiae]ARK31773.1 2',5' RNA ligase family [Halalkalibacter krulwichiae]